VSFSVLCSVANTGGTLLRLTTLSTTITVTGLHPYYTHRCNVSAVTVDEGPFSDLVDVTTLEDGIFAC
jgi:hypothetical protein